MAFLLGNPLSFRNGNVSADIRLTTIFSLQLNFNLINLPVHC